MLTRKQIRFCEEYMISLNATQAAIAAGYSKDTAYNIGWENVRKREIKEYIEARLKELTLSSEETLKSISDIARSSLNDYFILRQVVNTPRQKVPLNEIILSIKQEMEDADKYISMIGPSDEEREAHLQEQEKRRRTIIKHEIELQRNPSAYRIVDGEPILIETAELDLPRLVKDKAAGKIKSIKHSEFGINVELYAADAALRDMARVHGLFEKDNQQQAATTPQFTNEQFEKFLDTARGSASKADPGQ